MVAAMLTSFYAASPSDTARCLRSKIRRVIAQAAPLVKGPRCWLHVLRESSQHPAISITMRIGAQSSQLKLSTLVLYNLDNSDDIKPPPTTRALAIEPTDEPCECLRLWQRHDRPKRQRRAVGVVAIGNATN